MKTGSVNSLLRFGVPGLILGAALVWLFPNPRMLTAQGQTYAGASGRSAIGHGGFPASGGSHDSSGAAHGTILLCLNDPTNPSPRLVMLDAQKKALAVYRIEAKADRTVIKLEAARQCKWDLDLTEYNNLAPAVSAVEAMVRNPNANSVHPNPNPNSSSSSYSDEH